jgi:hypothetical protein
MTTNRDDGPASGRPALVTDRRRALLTAALGFLQQLPTEPVEGVMLRRYMDLWQGLGDVAGGLNAQQGT